MVSAKLLDQGIYLASVTTMYRLRRRNDEVQARRCRAVHPAATQPELFATRRNQVWSWDTTKLQGPRKWTYFCLDVIVDIDSRYGVGWPPEGTPSVSQGGVRVSRC